MPLLNQLICDSWELWRNENERDATLVPTDSAPILWFGNEEAYQTSAQKIVTIGVNPGPLAFPIEDPWYHYPTLGALTLEARSEPVNYDQAMNAFTFDAWFKSFNALLRPLGAAFGEQSPHEALHLDICPLMTAQLWSTLPHATQNRLGQAGVHILRGLLEYLAPDKIFISVSQDNFTRFLQTPLNLTLEHTQYLQTPISNVRHEVSEVTSSTINAQMIWFRKTGVRPISPANISLRQLGQHLSDPDRVSDPRLNGDADQVNNLVLQNQEQESQMNRNQFREHLLAAIENHSGLLQYSNSAGGYHLFKLSLTNDPDISLPNVRGLRSFVNVIFELRDGAGKAFIEITPHFTTGWRKKAIDDLRSKIPIADGATYMRLINFNHILDRPITEIGQIEPWVIVIEEELEQLFTHPNTNPTRQWKYSCNQLKGRWHIFNRHLPFEVN